ncbi:hypothetical protein PALB_13710 [Pseudoalteromonas luteoviolacea B = ATCC 29581]|nr:hypothetical protein PALB_13710 [Pseudoalteromonas luteoviolacea B = ATCC 29581]
MYQLLRFFWVLTCICNFLPIVAQADEFWPLHHYDIQNWSVADGLPQISVYDIEKDSQGYLWLATEKGIVKFDGARFTTYSKEHTSLLENPRINRLLWTSNNELLIATDSEFIRFKNGRFTSIDTSVTDSKRVTDLIQTTDGKVFVAAGNLYLYDDNQLTEIHKTDSPITRLARMYNRVCLATTELYGCVSGNRFIPLGNSFPSNWHVTHLIEHQNHTFIGNQFGLFRLGDDQIWHQIVLGENQKTTNIRAVFAQNNSTLWVGTDTHLFRLYNGAVSESIEYKTQPILSMVLDGFVDEMGHLWIGTLISGLIRTELNAAVHIPPSQGIDDALIWSVGESEGTIFVGTAAGFYKQTSTKQFEQVRLQPTPNNSAVYSFHFDPSTNNLWLGTKGGLSLYDSREFTLKQRFPQLDRVQINTIYQEETPNVWLGTQQGLWQFNGSDVTSHPDFENNIYGGVRTLYQHDGTLWVGTEKGLLKQQGANFVLVDHPILSNTFISTLSELSDGRLIVGTFQHGVYIKQDTHWQQLSLAQGLPMDNATYVTQLENVLLWGGLQGLMAIDITSLQTEQLKYRLIVDNTGNGRTTERNRCCNGAGANKGLTLDSETYFPTVAGVLKIYHRLIEKPETPAVPLFESLEVNGNIIQPPYDLNTKQKDWRLTFTTPYFGRAFELEFRYMLKGYDEQWKYSSELRQANYTNLPGGEYQFLVQVKKRGFSDWSDSLVTPISKQRTWFETWWFYMLLAVTFAIVFSVLWRYRSAVLLARQIELEHQVAKRTSELNNANKQLLLANEKLLNASQRDALTGLHNRHYLSTNRNKILAGDWDAEQFCILLVDLDDFKSINDTFGHAIGDEVLIQFADVLSRATTSGDHVLRWGGEEFVVISRHCNDLGACATSLLDSMLNAQWAHKQPVHASIGICSIAKTTMDESLFEDLLHIADKAMYYIKDHGKDGWCWIKLTSSLTPVLRNKLHESTVTQLKEIKEVSVTIHAQKCQSEGLFKPKTG